MRKTFFLYFLAVTVLLPWACSDNNSPSKPAGPALGGGSSSITPTFTGTIATATNSPTPTPTGVAPLTPTPTWTFIAAPPYKGNVGTSAAPNGMYYDAANKALIVAEAENKGGTVVNGIEQFFVPLSGASAVYQGVGNIFAIGQATPIVLISTPTPEVIVDNGIYNFPVGAVSSNGSIAVLDNQTSGSATLWAEDNNWYWPPAGPGGPFMNWTTGFGGASFHNPKCLTADPAGYLYVADTGSGYIDEFGPGNYVLGSSPGWIHRWNGPGAGFGPGVKFIAPNAVVCDAFGQVFVADTGPFVVNGVSSSMVQVYSSGGTSILGSFNLIPNCVVNGIATDSAGDFYVSDIANGEVEEYQMMPYPFVPGSPSTLVGLVTAWGDPHSYHEFYPYTPSCLQFVGTHVIVGDSGNNFLNIFGP
jgi:hypothetical protein